MDHPYLKPGDVRKVEHTYHDPEAWTWKQTPISFTNYGWAKIISIDRALKPAHKNWSPAAKHYLVTVENQMGERCQLPSNALTGWIEYQQPAMSFLDKMDGPVSVWPPKLEAIAARFGRRWQGDIDYGPLDKPFRGSQGYVYWVANMETGYHGNFHSAKKAGQVEVYGYGKTEPEALDALYLAVFGEVEP